MVEQELPEAVLPKQVAAVRRKRTVMGLGDRFVDVWGSRVRWIADAGIWMIYGGKCWQVDQVESYIQSGARLIIREYMPEHEALLYSSEREKGPDGKESASERDEFLAWVRKQESPSVVKAMVADARQHQSIFGYMDDFDKDPYEVGVENGVYNVEVDTFQKHDARHNLRTLSPVVFDREARCPLWRAFLKQVQPDPEVRAYLQRIVGYTLTGETSEQVFFGHYGEGSNGKGVFFRVLQSIMGEYAQAAPEETFLGAGRGGSVPNDLARMAGKRLILVNELPAGKRLNEALLKRFTGEDLVPARFLNKEFFEFRPTGKIHFVGNYEPFLASGGKSMERRMRDIGWEVVVPAGKRDPGLAGKIVGSELSGVLNWAIEGAQMWLEDGLQVPERSRERTDRHVKESDILYPWMSERLEKCGWSERVEQMVLYVDYKFWCEENGQSAMSNKAFGSALEARGVRRSKVKSRSRREQFEGVKLFEVGSITHRV